METQRSVYAIYGVRLADDTDRTALEEDPGHCANDGAVGAFWAGEYDNDMVFLALRWARVEPGGYVFHSGEQANALLSTRERWNADLRAVADRINAEIVEGPGWFTVSDEA